MKRFLHDCPMCQKMDPVIQEVSAARFTTATYEPFARISMDTIGPLPESEEGYKFILVIIDCFTRIVELYPCESTEGQEAANHLLDFISRYGTPEQVLSDRGSQFVNKVISAALQMIGTEHVLSNANSKQETAIVERANKEVLRFLIPMIYDSKVITDWAKYLPIVRRIMVTHPHESIGVAPITLLYGCGLNLEKGVFPEEKLPESEITGTSETSKLDTKWLADLHSNQIRAIKTAQQVQKNLDAENLTLRTENSEPVTEFAVGSYVLALYKDSHSRGKGRPPNKLLTIKRGPFRVISNSGNMYRIQSLAHDNITERHVKDLQPFIFDADQTDPFSISLGDEQEFEIERVVTHEWRANPDPLKKAKKLFLLIKWEDYDESENTWEPIQGVVGLPLIRDYLRANKLWSVVPKTLKEDAEKNVQARKRRKK